MTNENKVLSEEFAHEIALGSINEITIEYDLSTIAIVGQNMKNVPGVAGKFFDTLGRSGIKIRNEKAGVREVFFAENQGNYSPSQRND